MASGQMKRVTLLAGGSIVDGSGANAWVGDVMLYGDRIVAMSTDLQSQLLKHLPAGTTPAKVDVHPCTGLVLAPGFIDVHTHDEPSC